MFQRRQSRSRWQKIREALWPSMGAGRLMLYYRHRLGRLQGTPYSIAAGFASGAAVSFTPFIGFHLMSGALLCWLLRGSMLAMALGTLLGNPWTFPLIWIGTYELGQLLLGLDADKAMSSVLARHFTLADLAQHPLELLLPMTVGSLVPGVLSWIVSFYFVRHLVGKHRSARLSRINRPPRRGAVR